MEFFSQEYLNSLAQQNREELYAVYYFVTNRGDENFKESDFNATPDDILIDVLYKSEKFQITTGSPNLDAVYGKLKKDNNAVHGNASGENVDINGLSVKMIYGGGNDELQTNLLNPIVKKWEKHRGGSVYDLNLIVFAFKSIISYTEDDFLFKNFIQENKEVFNKAGFKSIYWSNTERNIRVY